MAGKAWLESGAGISVCEAVVFVIARLPIPAPVDVIVPDAPILKSAVPVTVRILDVVPKLKFLTHPDVKDILCTVMVVSSIQPCVAVLSKSASSAGDG